jgi:hypothetical protein
MRERRLGRDLRARIDGLVQRAVCLGARIGAAARTDTVQPARPSVARLCPELHAADWPFLLI